VTIENRQYSSSALTAKTEFTVTNKDGVGHTLTDDNGAFSVDVPGGGSAPLTIDTPGTYNVHCNIHGSMHGTITVA
jgi:plastocyanin